MIIAYLILALVDLLSHEPTFSKSWLILRMWMHLIWTACNIIVYASVSSALYYKTKHSRYITYLQGHFNHVANSDHFRHLEVHWTYIYSTWKHSIIYHVHLPTRMSPIYLAYNRWVGKTSCTNCWCAANSWIKIPVLCARFSEEFDVSIGLAKLLQPDGSMFQIRRMLWYIICFIQYLPLITSHYLFPSPNSLYIYINSSEAHITAVVVD